MSIFSSISLQGICSSNTLSWSTTHVFITRWQCEVENIERIQSTRTRGGCHWLCSTRSRSLIEWIGIIGMFTVLSLPPPRWYRQWDRRIHTPRPLKGQVKCFVWHEHLRRCNIEATHGKDYLSVVVLASVPIRACRATVEFEFN